MTQDRFRKSILAALHTAGKCASVFGGCLLLLFFVAAAFVMGDGTAPKFTKILFSIVDYTVKLLGISHGGSVFTVSFFWALIVFVLVFIFKLGTMIKSSDEPSISRVSQYTALIFVVIFLLGIFIIYNNRQNKMSVSEEKQLVLEFVKRDKQIMQNVGGSGTVNLQMVNMRDNKPLSYYVGVNGVKTIYAIVDVSRGSGKPVFTIACTYEDWEHPCRQY